MRAHIAYLWYVLRHKWFVFVECVKLSVPFLGLVHDWSKLLPSEFVPYARHFYGDFPDQRENAWVQMYWTGPTKQSIARDFDRAWLHHQHWNKHHWQHWILVQDTDPTVIIPMPDKYRREMLADWRGAGRAITGTDNTAAWYKANGGKMELASSTREWIEEHL